MESGIKSEILNEFFQITGSINNPYVEEWRRQGGRIVGYICNHVPKEIIMAAGMLPFRVRGTGSRGSELSEVYTGQICCPYPRHFFNQALKGEYSFLEGMILSYNCDHYRRLFDNWARTDIGTPHLQILAHPKQTEEWAIEWYRDEITIYKDKLEKHIGMKITDENLQDSIKLSNETRRLQRKLYELKKKENPPITGAETVAIMVASTAMPLDLYNKKLEELLNEIGDAQGNEDDRVRLMILSADLDNPIFIEMIEEVGGSVVTDLTCFGSKMMLYDIDETQSDPISALAKYYVLDIPSCPHIDGDHPRRIEQILALARDYKVDGIIGEWLIFCDVWRSFHYLVNADLKEAGIPFIAIERDYIPSFMGQLKTRVQAFIEMLRGAKNG